MRDSHVVAAAARTLERMRTYVKTVVPRAEREAVLERIAALPLEQLAVETPVEAEHRIESIVLELRGSSETRLRSVVCASRASALAMVQTRMVAARLAQAGIATTILNVTTTGDRVQDRSLAAIGSESLFVKELELALRDGRADYAVHSCKDLPSTLPDDMQIAAISPREDPRDVFCSERYGSFEALPAGARVGTSSLRRRAQLAALRPDLEYADIRGNVDTRLRKLRDGAYDAIVLAQAGLTRLGVRAAHSVPFDPEQIVPAVAQGALAIETRKNDAEFSGIIRRAIDDPQTAVAVYCERAALRVLQGGCQAPIGIHARFESGELIADGAIAMPDGSLLLRERKRGRAEHAGEAEALGTALAHALLDRGAHRILDAMPAKEPRS